MPSIAGSSTESSMPSNTSAAFATWRGGWEHVEHHVLLFRWLDAFVAKSHVVIWFDTHTASEIVDWVVSKHRLLTSCMHCQGCACSR